MKIKYWCNIILGLLLIGCGSTTRNYSNREPFNKYVNKNVDLKRAGEIWKVHSQNEYGFLSNSLKYPGSNYPSSYASKIVYLPVGTKILVEKVMRKNIHSTLSSSAVYAICSTTRPDGSVIRFEYTWGILGDIKMAPWEPLGLGERKY